ncbi:MAG: hypothetical protein ACJAQ9_001171 [Ilumatobacter sp.]|jgi:hypothetical protein
MKISKRRVVAMSVLAAGTLLAAATSAQADPAPTLTDWLSRGVGEHQVIAGTYVTAGAGATIGGAVLAGTYMTAGAGVTIEGNTAAVTATTFGAGSVVAIPADPTDPADPADAVRVRSGTATTLGANATVANEVGTPVLSGTAITLGAGASVPGGIKSNDPNIAADLAKIAAAAKTDIVGAQGFLGGTRSDDIPHIPGNIAANKTLTAGTYVIPGLLTVAANTIITLDAGGEDSVFQFNISSYLTFGAGSKVQVINTTDNTVTPDRDVSVTVIWNVTGGHVAVGAGAEIVGDIFAKGYVSTGADSKVSGPGNTCGGAVYSATSYISVGAGATLGAGADC